VSESVTTETSQERPGAWRYLLPFVLFVALVGVFSLTLWKIREHRLNIEEIKSPLIGRAAPAFDLPSLANPAQRVANAAFHGRPYLVNVWGTWCGECRAEHGTLLELAKSGQVPILGLDWKDDSALAQSYLVGLGNPYTAVANDADGRVAIDWGVYGAPETFLVSADGIVLAKHIGAMTIDVWRHDFAPRIGGARP
jgi:cytochrome c biogenesis protein CcmG, thiol:disulfide interchange protein DsbE